LRQVFEALVAVGGAGCVTLVLCGSSSGRGPSRGATDLAAFLLEEALNREGLRRRIADEFGATVELRPLYGLNLLEENTVPRLVGHLRGQCGIESADAVVVNGMSPSNRGSRWANAGWVVEIRPEDLPDCLCQGMPEGDASLPPVLSVMDFQERLERLCRLNGGMTQTAPAQFPTIHNEEKWLVNLSKEQDSHELLFYLAERGKITHFNQQIPSVSDIFIQTIQSVKSE